MISPATCTAGLRLALLAIATAWAALATPQAAADDWATRLGYPEGARVLIIHAHRMGLAFETNDAIEKLMDDGPLTSASAMPPCPWFAHAAQWHQGHRDSDMGLEFTINSPLPHYRWRNLSGDEFVNSLTDGDGYQWSNVTQVMVGAQADQVEHELRMQILHAERMGLRPTHFTTHLGALYSRPDLAEVYLRLARQQWVPAVVIDLTPELAERFRRDGYPVPDSMVQILEAYPLPKIRDLKILPSAESLEDKAAAVAEMIDELEPGLTQLACAPATDSPAFRELDPNWQQWVWDAQVWDTEPVKAALAKDDVVITNWREIMQRFDGSGNTAGQ